MFNSLVVSGSLFVHTDHSFRAIVGNRQQIAKFALVSFLIGYQVGNLNVGLCFAFKRHKINFFIAMLPHKYRMPG